MAHTAHKKRTFGNSAVRGLIRFFVGFGFRARVDGGADGFGSFSGGFGHQAPVYRSFPHFAVYIYIYTVLSERVKGRVPQQNQKSSNEKEEAG